MNDNGKVEKRIQELEAQLLEQDHRLPQVLLRFWKRKNDYPDEGDPRRFATVKALFFAILFSPAGVAFTGSILPAATLAVLIWQTRLMSEANATLREQIMLKTEAYLLLSKIQYVKDKGVEIEGTINNSGSGAILIQKIVAGFDYKDGGAEPCFEVEKRSELLSAKAILPLKIFIPLSSSMSREMLENGFKSRLGFDFIVQIQNLQTEQFYAKISCSMYSSTVTTHSKDGPSKTEEYSGIIAPDTAQIFGQLTGFDPWRFKGWGHDAPSDSGKDLPP